MKRITTLAELIALAEARRAVVINRGGRLSRPLPAVFVAHWQGFRIQGAMEAGMFLYQRKP